MPELSQMTPPQIEPKVVVDKHLFASAPTMPSQPSASSLWDEDPSLSTEQDSAAAAAASPRTPRPTYFVPMPPSAAYQQRQLPRQVRFADEIPLPRPTTGCLPVLPTPPKEAHHNASLFAS